MHNCIVLRQIERERERGRPKHAYIQGINENTESFKNYLRKFRNSPNTKINYTNWLKRFIEYVNLPDVRVKAGIQSVVGDNTDLLLFDNDKRKIQNIIKYFIDYQYEVKGLSPATVHSHYMAVKHFYESNEITLNWPIVKEYVGVVSNMKRDYDMPYTYEEIHKMLDMADERERCVVLLLASSGMRRGALPELKYGDLKWIEKYQIYEIRVYAGFPEEYTSYCSIECAAALNSYLDFRRNYGEVITDDSYLIRKQFNTRNHKGKIKVSYATDPPQKHKISNKNIEKMLYHLLYDSGIRKHGDKVKRLGDRHRNYMSHAYRKFFENKCLESGVDPFYVSVLMGHKAGIGVERSYYRPDSIQGEYSLLELYVKKAMPYLTISDESRLKLKNRELEIRLKEESSRFDSLQEQINQIMAANKKYGL